MGYRNTFFDQPFYVEGRPAANRLIAVKDNNATLEYIKALLSFWRGLREGWLANIDMWVGSTQVVTGTGTTALDTGSVRIALTTGTTHASTAGRIKRVPVNPDGTDAGDHINFTKPSYLYAVLHGDGAAGFPSTTMRLYCEDQNPGTLAALANHGYGISVVAGAISLATRGSGGSEVLVATSPAKTIASGAYDRHILIEHNPATYVRLYMDGVLVAEQTTAANIPSNTGGATNLKFAILRSGGVDVTDNALRLIELQMGGTYA